MPDTTASDRLVARLLAQLGRELDDMAAVGESLQGLLGGIAEGRPVDAGFIVDSQKLDGLVQQMSELSRFLDRLATETTSGLSDGALKRAASPIRLAGLSERLVSSAHSPSAATSGEYELW